MFYRVLLCIPCMLLSLYFFSLHCFSFKDYMPRVFTKTETVIVPAKEYIIKNLTSVELKNITGTIKITSWDQKDKVAVDAVKNGTAQELDQTTIRVSTKDGHATITTNATETEQAASVDYRIIVPIDTAVKTAISQKGNIKIKNVHGSIQATTLKGDIAISESAKSVIAKASKGSVTIKQLALKEPATIFAEVLQGNITIILPADIQANVRATTHYGTITSTQKITIDPLTVILSKKDYWDRVKQEVQGKFGEGGPSIIIDVSKGNIAFDSY